MIETQMPGEQDNLEDMPGDATLNPEGAPDAAADELVRQLQGELDEAIDTVGECLYEPESISDQEDIDALVNAMLAALDVTMRGARRPMNVLRQRIQRARRANFRWLRLRYGD